MVLRLLISLMVLFFLINNGQVRRNFEFYDGSFYEDNIAVLILYDDNVVEELYLFEIAWFHNDDTAV